MKRNFKRVFTIVFSVLLMSVVLMTSAYAYVPYTAYNFDYYGDIVSGPAGYVPEKVLFGADMGLDELTNPTDMYVTKDNRVYIVDHDTTSTYARVVILDENLKLIKIIDKFYGTDGKALTVNNLMGVCVDDDGYIYLCDPDNFRILKINQSGKTVLTYGAPPQEYVTDSFTYRPQKLAIGINGSIYVLSQGCTDGILEFDTKGVFVRFFGAPEVELSVSDYINIYWRNIYRVFGGDQVDAYFATYVPSEFSNLTVDENGFVFTMVAANESSTEELYKLNFIGTNILDPNQKSTKKKTTALSANYGDLITRSTIGEGNTFADVCTDSDGFFSLLDNNLGKVFEYDKEGNLIFVYGNKGNEANQIQAGLLDFPSAIAKLNDRTLVLDGSTGAITVYKLSDYGKQLHQAVNLYNLGKYEESRTPWNNVLKYDANSELAHIGLGKVYYLQGEYKEALAEFKLGNDRNNYSRTYKLYRDEVIRANFGWVITIIVVLIILLVVNKKFGKRIRAAIKNKRKGVSADE